MQAATKPFSHPPPYKSYYWFVVNKWVREQSVGFRNKVTNFFHGDKFKSK